jgi:methylated-DNA-[protein]-cysteine S-methyltransferase
MKPHTILVFPSQIGWMAAVLAGEAVKRLTFGHPTAAAARAAVKNAPRLRSRGGDAAITGPAITVAGRFDETTLNGQIKRLVRRLQAYAAGKPDDFRDVRIDPGPLGEFQRRVLNQCRRVPYGATISYAQLAAKAGSPRAARAAGNCMAGNLIPLIIPCHRVVCSDGRVGAYSALGGSAMKRRLLAMESRASEELT